MYVTLTKPFRGFVIPRLTLYILLVYKFGASRFNHYRDMIVGQI